MSAERTASPLAERQPASLILELRAALERASRLAEALELDADSSDLGSPAALVRRLNTAEEEIAELVPRLVAAEQRASQLMNLYVATYQLYATQDPDEVQRTIAEIAVDLLGAESFALLLRTSGGGASQIPLFQGPEDSLFARGAYRGGDPSVDATLVDGLLRIGREEGSAALAVVPLRVQDAVVGALVILKLFDHKPALSAQDRDLFDLLAAHAASALLAARTASATERRLQTLESLLELLRGEP